jgi:hypothetical protein
VAPAVRLKVAQQDLGGQVEVAPLTLVHVIEFDFVLSPTAGGGSAGFVHGAADHAGVVHVTGRMTRRHGDDAVGVTHFSHVGQGGVGAKAVAGQQNTAVTLGTKSLDLRADFLQCRRIAGVISAPA